MITCLVKMQAPDVANVDCDPANDTHPNCVEGEIPYAGNGAMTGNCTVVDPNKGRCEIRGWCPTEIENTTIT